MFVGKLHYVIVTSLLVLIMALALTGCGDNSQTPTTQPSSPVPTQPASPPQPPSPLATRTGGIVIEPWRDTGEEGLPSAPVSRSTSALASSKSLSEYVV